MRALDPSLQQWLDQRTKVAGVLACGITQPDGQFRLCSHSATLPAAQVAAACQRIGVSVQKIFAEHYPGQQFSWAFDQMQIVCVNRPDRILLILFLRREMATPEMAVVQQICQEFCQ